MPPEDHGLREDAPLFVPARVRAVDGRRGAISKRLSIRENHKKTMQTS